MKSYAFLACFLVLFAGCNSPVAGPETSMDLAEIMLRFVPNHGEPVFDPIDGWYWYFDLAITVRGAPVNLTDMYWTFETRCGTYTAPEDCSYMQFVWPELSTGCRLEPGETLICRDAWFWSSGSSAKTLVIEVVGHDDYRRPASPGRDTFTAEAPGTGSGSTGTRESLRIYRP